MCLLLINEYASNNTDYDSPKQGGFPVIVLEMINISDTVIASVDFALVNGYNENRR